MKLSELLKNQELNVQIKWDEKIIEFSSFVLECDKYVVYITPFNYKGKELELNISGNSNIVCNLYTNDEDNKRISWKAIELTTVERHGKKVYCLKAHAFNNVSCVDDRRSHERIPIQVDAWLFDMDDTESVTIHDISDNGLGIYAPCNFEPKSRQILISFTDSIGKETFNFKLECDIARMKNENGVLVIGCRLTGENKEYQVYELMKRLRIKYSDTTSGENKMEKEAV